MTNVDILKALEGKDGTKGDRTVAASRAAIAVALSEEECWFYFRRYEWFRDVFYPALRNLSAGMRRDSDRRLLSLGHAILADVHDTNDAPMASLRQYKVSLQYDPKNAAAWREMGYVYLGIGKAEDARRALTLAMDLSKGDEDAEIGLRLIGEMTARERAMLFDEHTTYYGKFRELLARGHAQAVLRHLAKDHSCSGHQYRARAYGVLSDTQGVIGEWQRLSERNDAIEMQPADWFFLPVEADCPVFWQTVLSMVNRLTWVGCGGVYSSLYDILPSPRRGRIRSKAGEWRTRRLLRLSFKLALARSEKNVEALGKLVEKYPRWPDPKLALEEILAHQKG